MSKAQRGPQPWSHGEGAPQGACMIQWGNAPVGRAGPVAGAPAQQTQRPLGEDECEVTGRDSRQRGEHVQRPRAERAWSRVSGGMCPRRVWKDRLGVGESWARLSLTGLTFLFQPLLLLFLSPLIPGGWVLVPQTGTFLFMHPPQAAALPSANSPFQTLPRENTPDP